MHRFQKRLVKIGYNPKDVEGAKRDMFWNLSEYSVRKFNNKGFVLFTLAQIPRFLRPLISLPFYFPHPGTKLERG